MFWRVLWAVLFAYVAWAAHEILGIFYPTQCIGKGCFRTLLPPESRVDLWAALTLNGSTTTIWSVLNVSIDSPLTARFEVPIPTAVRLGEQSELPLSLLCTFPSAQSYTPPHLELRAHASLVGVMPLRREAVMLLGSNANRDSNHPALELAGAVEDLKSAAHFLYSRSAVVLRLVTDATAHTATHFADGLPIGSSVDRVKRRYAPHFYVDTFSLLQRHAAPLSRNVTKEHPFVQLHYKPTSVGRYRLMGEVQAVLHGLQSLLGVGHDEFEEIRELLSEDRIYRFMLMQVIGMLHVIFDMLAFKNDVGFWRGKEGLQGISSRSVIFSAACQLVIYLYLLDSDSINTIVLVTYSFSIAIEAWKVWRVLLLRSHLYRARSPTQRAATNLGRSTGLLSDAAKQNAEQTELAKRAERAERATERFDAIATRTLGLGLAPLVAGWALYCLHYYPHTSWYSWILSSLADAVYLFGFVGMTPQLFINYKLRSVAHLPWRVLAYKAFNTFIDDAFALMVSMPTAHRVACLRDDAVFVVLLYQRWIYPVDYSRTNEYGYAFESMPTCHDEPVEPELVSSVRADLSPTAELACGK
mmetsp:Transcript_446/g.846  ORF Transcript_446/g.846 Transcript_446/m.846 type:complete len:584 (-) Transcript_446:484-2235(-)